MYLSFSWIFACYLSLIGRFKWYRDIYTGRAKEMGGDERLMLVIKVINWI